jgi:NADPH2:quinone reductase
VALLLRLVCALKAIEITAFGGPEVLRLTQRPTPVASPGEVLIRVAASGVNRPDVLQRKGRYAPPPGVSDIPGLEVAGVVEFGEPQALVKAGLSLGQRVCALVSGGGYAQLCTAPIGQVLPVPSGLSDVEAASLPETFFTVWSNLFDRAALQPGETVLIHGGSSGIGVAAIQLAKAWGARVLVTVGSDEKAQACLGLGADLAVNYRKADFVAAVLHETDGRGVNVILDMVAGEYTPRNVSALADDGRLVLIAVQGGARADVDLGAVLRRRLTITGSTLRPRAPAFKAAIAASLRQHVWPWIEAGRVRPVVYRVFDAEQAQEAHAVMESSEHIGKLVLRWATR